MHFYFLSCINKIKMQNWIAGITYPNKDIVLLCVQRST